MMFPFFIFFWFLLMSIMMAFSSSSLFFLWICLEINMMSFIPLMFSKNIISMNSTVTYFLIQSTASSIYIFTISVMFFSSNLITHLPIMIMISMLIKLGSAPFHIWFPQVSEGLSFNSLLILLTLQKMIPLYIISMFKNNILIIPITLSALMGSFGGFNQFSLRKILAFSSISHLSWILTLLLVHSNYWLFYLAIYSTITLVIIFFINNFMMNFYNFSSKANMELNFMFIILLLSLGGMPPTIGFIMKWTALKIICNNILIITIPLILSSLINLFFYTRLTYTSMLKHMIFYKWEKYFPYKLFWMIFYQILIIFLMVSMI
uniref:NADH dehydrogenase subunit 2 n=1 Tax=Ornithodoros tabajara TaxID=2928877 RepID=UPI0022371FD9|nr:NADH dehydrogenase subunit 2 [Ornithodoros tabajara]UYB78639.1 NADH dehydrogenase subunit 2 [Ornithodoros tabajara]UYB78652.1 NADH dehydrogenase subunit 2 [Ornithodoros tabajara]